MKTKFYLTLQILSAIYTTCLAQKPMLTINFEYIKNKVNPFFDKNSETLIVVFKSQADLKTNFKNLTISTNVKKLNETKSYIYGTQNDVNKPQLIFDLTKTIDDKTPQYQFAFLIKGKKIADLLLQRKKDPITPKETVKKDSSKGDSSNRPVYNPDRAPDTFDILKDIDTSHVVLPISPVFKINEKDYGTLNYSNEKDINRVIYSFCDNKLYFVKAKDRKKFRPKVGTPISFELNTVPNPSKYDVTIKSSYITYNTKPDTLLKKYFFNAAAAQIGESQKSGGNRTTIDTQTITRKNKLLGYLQKIQVQLQTYLDENFNNQDCIDADLFNRQRKKIKANINTQLAKEFVYPGDLLIFIQNQFSPADSSYVNQVITTYKLLTSVKVAPYIYKIAQLDNADEIMINWGIKPKASSGATYRTDTVIRLPIFGGFKIDFSPGIFYNSFTSPTYSFRLDSTVIKSRTGTDSVKNKYNTIVQEKKPNYEMGFSSFMHFYTRTGKTVNFAATIGVGVTIDSSPQIRYLTGGSIIFGRKARVGLSYGYSFGQINQLSDKYINMQAPSTDKGPSTKKIWNHGHFFSISYNIPF